MITLSPRQLKIIEGLIDRERDSMDKDVEIDPEYAKELDGLAKIIDHVLNDPGMRVTVPVGRNVFSILLSIEEIEALCIILPRALSLDDIWLNRAETSRNAYSSLSVLKDALGRFAPHRRNALIDLHNHIMNNDVSKEN